MKHLAIALVVLAFSSIGFALDCASDSDCPSGFSCTDSGCVGAASGSGNCNAFCANSVAYQTAYSNGECWISGVYPCSYGCAASGPDCATQQTSQAKTLYCTDSSYSSVRECTITYPPGASASTLSCIADCKRANSIPMAVAQAGGMVDVLIEDDFRNCVTSYCLSTAPSDKCAGVSCDDKCENSVYYTAGTCDSATGNCEYDETPCPQGCATDYTGCKGSVAGQVFYYDDDGNKVPIRFATMEFYAVKNTRILFYGNVNTDASGKFEWSDPRIFTDAAEVSGTLYLNESKARVYVSESPQVSGPVGIVIANGIPVTDASLANLQADLTKLKNKNLTAAAIIYSTGQKAAEFKEDVLKLKPTVRERIIAFNQGGNFHFAEFYPDTAADPTGITLLRNTSKFGNQFLSDTVFHEYCHHIQDEVQGAPHSISGSDHGGYYANPDSEWGMVEGWAEFCALEMKRQYHIEKYGLYRIRGSEINLELNYRMDDRVWKESEPWGPGMIEEMGVASLLVDLRDSPSDYGGIDDDHVNLPLSTIWDAFRTKRDFNDGQGARDVHTVRDFYLALKEETKGNTELNSPYLRGSNLTNLDAVFVKHGAYQDLNNNSKWDDGEPIGYSGKNATLRADLEPINGTQVAVTVLDQGGKQVTAGISVHVVASFQGDDSYLSYEYDVPLDEGSVNVPLPPREYNATITMTAFQAGTYNRAPNSFSVSNGDAYGRIDPEAPLGSYLATVNTGTVPCSADYECSYAGIGDYCASGTCSSSGPNPQPGPEPWHEPVPMPCEGIFLVLGALIFSIFAKGKAQ